MSIFYEKYSFTRGRVRIHNGHSRHQPQPRAWLQRQQRQLRKGRERQQPGNICDVRERYQADVCWILTTDFILDCSLQARGVSWTEEVERCLDIYTNLRRPAHRAPTRRGPARPASCRDDETLFLVQFFSHRPCNKAHHHHYHTPHGTTATPL